MSERAPDVRKAGGAQPPAPRAPERLRGVCTFRVDGRLYGLDITQVREVSMPLAVTPVPQAPPLVRGLVNLRSRIYLALDIRPALGLPPIEATADSRLIVLHPRVAERLGVWVEQGGDIVPVAADRIEALAHPAAQPAADRPDDASSNAAAPVVAVCKLDGELLMVIDSARLVGALEAELGRT